MTESRIHFMTRLCILKKLTTSPIRPMDSTTNCYYFTNAFRPLMQQRAHFMCFPYQGLEYEISCVECKPRTAVFALGSILKVIPSLVSPHRQYATNIEKEQFGNMMNVNRENPFDAQKVQFV